MTSPSPAAEAKHIPIAHHRSDHDLPSPYSMTPGGTIYSTTPGGTKIKYDRNMLMFLSRSPYSQTPPASALPLIPGVTAPKAQHDPLHPHPHSDNIPNDHDNDDDDDAVNSSDEERTGTPTHKKEHGKKASPKDDGDDLFGMEP